MTGEAQFIDVRPGWAIERIGPTEYLLTCTRCGAMIQSGGLLSDAFDVMNAHEQDRRKHS